MNSPPAKLTVLDGHLQGREYPIQGPLVIGRMKGVAIQLPDNKVSREHSKVYRQGDEYCIVDLNSSNGTLVNDAPVTKRVLRNGDEILLGETRFRFEMEQPEEEAAEVSASAQAPSATVKEVVDLSATPPSTPAGAIRADEIVVKDKALQFSKYTGKKKGGGALFGDIGQKNLGFQIVMFVIAAVVFIVFLLIGLNLGGVIGG